MNDPALTPEELKRLYFSEIEKSSTFKPQGVSQQAAKDYLNTQEGALYLQRVTEAATPDTSSIVIDQRAIEQLMSARELPRVETIQPGEYLIKFVAEGSDLTSYSPYWTPELQGNKAISEGRNISDYFSLPAGSEGRRYGMYKITVESPTQIFINTVAPTSELGGLITKNGGAEQVLVPNRKLFTAPVQVKIVDNIPSLPADVSHFLTPTNALEEGAFRTGLSPVVSRIVGGAAAVGAAYDAYTTAEQYLALSAQGNQFGADALLHRYEGRTAGGVLGGFGAGVAYGAAAGSETGPGALITGALGGVIGAFAGDKIAMLVNEHQVNHQTGTDGVTYAYENGQWGRTQHRMDPNSDGPANPYGAGSYTATTTPAPTDKLAQLDYQRTTAITALALANPSAQDTKHITLDRTEWHATQEGWAQSVEMPGVPNAYGIPTTIKIDQPADAQTREQLNQIAANFQYNNDHYAEDVSKAYVMDYIGKGWSANGPLPEAVTHALKLPSEQHLADPATGTVWAATGKGGFERSVTTMAYMTPITETVKPHAEENSRLVQQQQATAQANAAYGQQLIAQHYAQMQAMHAQRQAQQETRDAAREASREAGHAEPGQREPAHAPAALAPSQHAAPPAATATVFPTLSPPLDPLALRDFRHAAHPLNARYEMFRDALGEQGFHQDRPTLNEAPAVRGYSADQKDRLAAGFTAQVGIDRRYSFEIQNFRKDGDVLLATEHPRRLGASPLMLAIPEAQSLARSPAQHAAAWRAKELPQPRGVDTARAYPRSLAPEHPGHPDHPRNPMFEHARSALTDEYARWGIQKGAESLDRETLQVMIGARANQLDDVGAIRLHKPNSDSPGIGEHPKLAVYATPESPNQKFVPHMAVIESQTLQHAPPVAQSALQFTEADKDITQMIQTNRELQAHANLHGVQGPTLGGPGGPGPGLGQGPGLSPGGPGL